MTIKVMLVDDEEGILALLTATLGNDGTYQLLLARDGNEALYVARREKPDILFLDIVMPNMDGYAVCRELKRDPATAQIRVVMLTALAQEGDRERGLEVGAEEYLTKLFSPTALLEKVTMLLSAPG